jgi:hypothetical protein
LSEESSLEEVDSKEEEVVSEEDEVASEDDEEETSISTTFLARLFGAAGTFESDSFDKGHSPLILN